jgi:hypothetical protein
LRFLKLIRGESSVREGRRGEINCLRRLKDGKQEQSVVRSLLREEKLAKTQRDFVVVEVRLAAHKQLDRSVRGGLGAGAG